MLGESASGSHQKTSLNDTPSLGRRTSLKIELGPNHDRTLIDHCLVATSYLISGLTHRASSPLGALLTNLSMLKSDLAELAEKPNNPGISSESEETGRASRTPIERALERALEDVEGALEIANRMRADLAIAKGFAAVPQVGETSNLLRVLTHWSKATASAALGAGALRGLGPELRGDNSVGPDDTWLVSGSVAALSHLLTTALVLIATRDGCFPKEKQVSIAVAPFEAGVQVTLSTSCDDPSYMTLEWEERANALGSSALAAVGSHASFEFALSGDLLEAKLVLQRVPNATVSEGSWA